MPPPRNQYRPPEASRRSVNLSSAAHVRGSLRGSLGSLRPAAKPLQLCAQDTLLASHVAPVSSPSPWHLRHSVTPMRPLILPVPPHCLHLISPRHARSSTLRACVMLCTSPSPPRSG